MKSEAFQNSQKAFFAEHCDKFDAEEENKLDLPNRHGELSDTAVAIMTLE